jgi:hypothetical protein
MQFSVTQPRLDQFDVLLWRGDALLRLLLEGVKYIYDAGKPYGVNRAVRIAVEILNSSSTVRPPNPLSAFAVTGSPPSCTAFKAKPTRFFTLAGKRLRSFKLEPIKMQGFCAGRLIFTDNNMGVSPYIVNAICESHFAM